jgi:hypothetical protein
MNWPVFWKSFRTSFWQEWTSRPVMTLAWIALALFLLTNTLASFLRLDANSQPMDPAKYPGLVCDMTAAKLSAEDPSREITAGWYKGCIDTAREIQEREDAGDDTPASDIV